MAFDIDQRYRIKRNSEQEEQMRYLVNDLKLFKSLSQLLVVSAVIGYINGKSRPFEKNAEPVLMNSFSERSYDMMNFIAYAEKKDQSVLKDGKQYQFFEAFASGGFPILLDKLNINFIDKAKNDRNALLLKYYSLLVNNGLYLDE